VAGVLHGPAFAHGHCSDPQPDCGPRLGDSKSSVSSRLRDLERRNRNVAGPQDPPRLRSHWTPLPCNWSTTRRRHSPVLNKSFEQAKRPAGKPRGLLRITAPSPWGGSDCALGAGLPAALSGDSASDWNLNDRFVNVAQEGFAWLSATHG